MSSRILGVAVILFGSVTLASACSVSASPGGGDDTVVCADEGSDCGSDADCCSDACGSDGTCSGADNCSLDNDACGSDSDCCSMLCASDGFCGLP
jgi:hypothetical protein